MNLSNLNAALKSQPVNPFVEIARATKLGSSDFARMIEPRVTKTNRRVFALPVCNGDGKKARVRTPVGISPLVIRHLFTGQMIRPTEPLCNLFIEVYRSRPLVLTSGEGPVGGPEPVSDPFWVGSSDALKLEYSRWQTAKRLRANRLLTSKTVMLFIFQLRKRQTAHPLVRLRVLILGPGRERFSKLLALPPDLLLRFEDGGQSAQEWAEDWLTLREALLDAEMPVTWIDLLGRACEEYVRL